MEDKYLSNLNKDDLKLSKDTLALLSGKKISKFRFDSKSKEVFIEFEDGMCFFIHNVQDKYDLSIC